MITGKKLILDSTLTDIADAIRSKTGSVASITPADMPDEIESIPTGDDEAPVIILTDGGAAAATAATVKTVGSNRPSSLANLFQNWKLITSIDMSGVDATDTQDISNLFYGCAALESITPPRRGFPALTTAKALFRGCERLTSTSVDLTRFDFSEVQSFEYMFYGCIALDAISFADIDFSSAISLVRMFYGCARLISADLSGLDLSHVTDMSNMFYRCGALTTIDMSGTDLSAVKNASCCFGNCSAVRSFDLTGADFSSLENMSEMFSLCKQLETLNLSGLDLSHVTSINSTFDNCSALRELDLSGVQLTSITDAYNMCKACTALETVNLSGVDFSGVTVATKFADVFKSCTALTTIITDANTKLPNVKMDLAFLNAPALSAQSVRNLFNALPDHGGNKIIKFDATVYARLSADDKAIATGKGWVVYSA